MTIGNRIKNRRIELGLSVDDLAERINKNRATIYRYEKGDIESLPTSILEPLAKALFTTPEYLIGWVDAPKNKSSKVINVLGRVAAGIPINAIEEIIDTEEIPEDLARTGSFFGLKIKGNSMEPYIFDNDVVIVKQQEEAESGDIVIAMVNGDDAVCKRLKLYSDKLALISINSEYDPMIYTNEDVEQKPVKIIGKVVEIRRKL